LRALKTLNEFQNKNQNSLELSGTMNGLIKMEEYEAKKYIENGIFFKTSAS